MPSCLNLLLVAGALLVGALDLGPRLYGYQVRPVWQASHAAGIGAGSAAVVWPVPPDALSSGDVIALRQPQRPEHVALRRIVDLRVPDSGRREARELRLQAESPGAPDLWEAQLFGTAWVLQFGIPRAATTVTLWGRYHSLALALLGLAAAARVAVLARGYHKRTRVQTSHVLHGRI